jgi:outer membrane protein
MRIVRPVAAVFAGITDLHGCGAVETASAATNETMMHDRSIVDESVAPRQAAAPTTLVSGMMWRWVLEIVAGMRRSSALTLCLCLFAATTAASGQPRRAIPAEPRIAPVVSAADVGRVPTRVAQAGHPAPSATSSNVWSVRASVSADDADAAPLPPQVAADPTTQSLDGGAPWEEIPAGFVPWWRQRALQSLRAAPHVQQVDLDALIISALAYSPRVRAVSEDVLIQETAVVEAQASFDVRAFAESKFFRKSEPIGNVLETGGPPRLREEDFAFSAGLRKKTPLGGSWEVSQEIGMLNSNSRFFSPEQQGNSALSLSFDQPLLNGFGKAYNTSLIILADLDTSVAMDETTAALEQQLAQIAEAYWELYLQRSVLVQKRQHLERARVVLVALEQRRDIDALESQIVRAQAAVAARQAELVRSAANIRNIEARVRALTNAPDLQANPQAELIPQDPPETVRVDFSLRDALVTALQHRPEIDAASHEIRAASVRLNMSKNELLPALDLVLETYVMGLDTDYDISQAWTDQFSVGEPSYSAGLLFEVPLQRRAAKARLQRRCLELRQVTERFDETIQVLSAEVEIAVRDVAATYQEMVGKYRAMLAAQSEVDYSYQRWQVMAGEDRSASLLLEDLLDAQDRLVIEEYGFALAQRNYTVSQTQLKRATGTLLRQEGIEPVRFCQGGLPQLQFQKNPALVTPAEVLPATEPRVSRTPTQLR